jgi:hypothetical protein
MPQVSPMSAHKVTTYIATDTCHLVVTIWRVHGGHRKIGVSYGEKQHKAATSRRAGVWRLDGTSVVAAVKGLDGAADLHQVSAVSPRIGCWRAPHIGRSIRFKRGGYRVFRNKGKRFGDGMDDDLIEFNEWKNAWKALSRRRHCTALSLTLG